MLLRVGKEGSVTHSQALAGEPDCDLTVAQKNGAYFFFAKGEEIAFVFPVPGGPPRMPLTPHVTLEPAGARVLFLNVNAQPVLTEFQAFLVLKSQYALGDVPSIADVLRLMSGQAPSPAPNSTSNPAPGSTFGSAAVLEGTPAKPMQNAHF